MTGGATAIPHDPRRDPMPGGPVLARVALAYPRLTRTERKIADVLLAGPLEFARTPMARIEARSGVSAPSVMRFCRAIGYGGLTDLKLALAASGALAAEAGGRSLPGKPVPCDAGKVLDQSAEVIEDLRRRLDDGAIDAAAEILAGAPGICCFASHQLGLAASYARDVFLRHGMAAVVPAAGQPLPAANGGETGIGAGLFFCHGMPDAAMFDTLALYRRDGLHAVIVSDVPLPAFIPAATRLVLGHTTAQEACAGALLAHCLMTDILLSRMPAALPDGGG
jgi:hypothetical protein